MSVVRSSFKTSNLILQSHIFFSDPVISVIFVFTLCVITYLVKEVPWRSLKFLRGLKCGACFAEGALIKS